MKPLSLFSYFLLFYCLHHVGGVAVMSVDLGSEWMKVAIVSPGVPMEIALNTESKRKTPLAIAFRDGERTFGDDALNVGVRFPANCYLYVFDLLGKEIDNPVVELYRKRFPYYDIIADPIRNTVLFRHDNSTTYSPEELVGMLLHKAKEFAEDSAGQKINEAVITVPEFFNRAERRSLLAAAELADLKVLQVMNDITAAGLNYGIFHSKNFNDTAQYIMLYDMGAYSTTAALISYQMVKTKEKGVVETNPHMTVLGVGYDRTLGGLEMQLRLRDYLGKKFDESKKYPTSVFENARSMAKLFKEAGRLKNVLSANAEHYAQIESLIEEVDFRLKVTREDFENLLPDLLHRVESPILQALKTSSLTMDIISQVIIIGAGTRVPSVQDHLTKIAKMTLGKNLNSDEAVVLGAAYKAADLSKGFRAKKFVTKDVVLFPILVTFDREESAVGVKRTLFGLANTYPQKKMLTFSKHQRDFNCTIGHGDLKDVYTDEAVRQLGRLRLSQVFFAGVSEAVAKHEGPRTDPKGVKVHFIMDESGILRLTSAEYVVEKVMTEAEIAAHKGASESTFSKISSTISKLFQGEEKEKEQEQEQDKSAESESGENGKNETEEVNKEKMTNDKDKAGNDKDENGEKEKEDGNKTKIVTFREKLEFVEKRFDVPEPTEEQMKEYAAKLAALNDYDARKFKREGALNALESAVIDTRMKMSSPDYDLFAKAEEMEKIQAKMEEVSTWLEDEGYDADAETLEGKLKELTLEVKPVILRYEDDANRADAVNALNEMITKSLEFVKKIAAFHDPSPDNVKKEDMNKTVIVPKPSFTNAELKNLDKFIAETKDWRDKSSDEQNALKKSDDPVFTVKRIMEKRADLEREVLYLVHKYDAIKKEGEREFLEREMKRKEREAAAKKKKEKESLPKEGAKEGEDKVEKEKETEESPKDDVKNEDAESKAKGDKMGHQEL